MRTRSSLLAVSLLALAACSSGGGDPTAQFGPHPHLPAIQQYLVPPMHVAGVAPWNGAKPVVPPGLQVEAFADAVAGNGDFALPPEHDLATMELLLRAQAMALPPGNIQ